MRRTLPRRSPARPLGMAAAGIITAALGVAAGRAILMRQAAIARERIGKPLGEESIDADRVWRRKLAGEPLELLVMGDSLAAGLGAEHRKQTLGGRLAKGLARELGRPVRLTTAAVVGSESNALPGQLAGLPSDYRADVAVIVVGGNDVTHLISPESAAQHLDRVLRDLSRRRTAVVVGTCPDLGALRPVPQPLRVLLSRMSRRMAAVQARVARRAGAIPVDLRAAVGTAFRAEPGEMFSLDRFHPSAAGYRRTAQALLPALVEALEDRGERTGTTCSGAPVVAPAAPAPAEAVLGSNL